MVVGVVGNYRTQRDRRPVTGLPRLPLREVPYRGRVLREFDLDAALARKPAVLLVDELGAFECRGIAPPQALAGRAADRVGH